MKSKPSEWGNARRVLIIVPEIDHVFRGWELLEDIEGHVKAGQIWFDNDDESTEPATSWKVYPE